MKSLESDYMATITGKLVGLMMSGSGITHPLSSSVHVIGLTVKSLRSNFGNSIANSTSRLNSFELLMLSSLV